MSWVVNDPEGAYPQTDIFARVWDRAVIDYLGNESEEGGKYGFISNPIVVEPLTFAFVGDLYEGPYEGVSGIWYQNARRSETWNIPEPHLLGITGAPFPGDTLPIENIEAYEPIDTTGGFALARIAQGGEVSAANDLGLWILTLDDEAALTLRTGDIDASTGSPISSIGKPSTNTAGQAAVWVEIGDADASEGIYIVSESVRQSLVVANAPIEIGEQTFTIESIFNPSINENGDVAFLATLSTDEDSQSYAIFRQLAGGNLEVVAKSGDQAAGTFAGTAFDMIAAPRLNGNGQVAFQATLSGDGDTVSNTTDSGLWAHDENGNLVLIAREGNTIETRADVFRTLSGFEIGGFNDAGQFALKLAFTNGESAIATGVAEPAAPPTIVDQPADTDTYMGEDVTLSVSASGQGPFLYQWYLNGEAIEGATESTLTVPGADTGAKGEYSVSVISAIGQVISSVASLRVLELPELPAFVNEPLGYIAFMGEEAMLDARAVASTPIAYQWYKDGSPIEGETGETLLIDPAISDDEGTCYVTATNAAGSVQSAGAEVLVTDKRIVNISTRAHVGTGSNVLIAGFAIGGTEKKTVLVRGIGPSLEKFGLSNILANPVLSLYRNGELIAENSGWSADSNEADIANASSSVGAFSLPSGSEDSAMLIELDPGVYTAIVSGEGNTTGIALVEVYEVNSNLSRLVNISSRAFVGRGSEIVIPGIVVVGDLPTDVLVRAVGPSLEEFGVSGVLENPVLEVLNIEGEVIASNDGWGGITSINEASQTVGAFPLDPESQDAGMILSLETGLYTLRISGEDGTTGVALVELYALP